ncbi:hypothetical protein KUTeg_014421 [Tegillarca granosa]|uniref:Uncharacterized protein n=1 Tax=Tegillarca granosa TaxID=220873 RepID=A0ABQ9EWL2_TEGGR|nr:hypothetical protein KUTeg_014421 [Tegillarca granosa]
MLDECNFIYTTSAKIVLEENSPHYKENNDLYEKHLNKYIGRTHAFYLKQHKKGRLCPFVYIKPNLLPNLLQQLRQSNRSETDWGTSRQRWSLASKLAHSKNLVVKECCSEYIDTNTSPSAFIIHILCKTEQRLLREDKSNDHSYSRSSRIPLSLEKSVFSDMNTVESVVAVKLSPLTIAYVVPSKVASSVSVGVSNSPPATLCTNCSATVSSSAVYPSVS